MDNDKWLDLKISDFELYHIKIVSANDLCFNSEIQTHDLFISRFLLIFLHMLQDMIHDYKFATNRVIPISESCTKIKIFLKITQNTSIPSKIDLTISRFLFVSLSIWLVKKCCISWPVITLVNLKSLSHIDLKVQNEHPGSVICIFIVKENWINSLTTTSP